jgi:hypothetical protein
MSELRSAALHLAAKGKPVFPCRPLGKEPLTPNGFYDATVDRAVVLAWWGRWPDANIGLRTGQASGLFVLDIDTYRGGMDTFARIAAYGEGLATLEATTGRGGLHLYFSLPDGVELGNSEAGIKARFGEAVECRGEGGYVIAPPSRLPEGRYSWGSGQLLPVPAWLVEILTTPEPTQARPASSMARVLPISGDRLLARFNALLEDVAQQTEGNRNKLLFWAACRLHEYQAEGAPRGWTDLLIQAGVAAGLDEAEARRAVLSGLRRPAS